MFKRKTRRIRNKKHVESLIKPNVELAIDELIEYKQVVRKERDLGYKGLFAAFSDKAQVKLIISTGDDQSEQITGTISHYDENYSQLVVVNGNSLKRLTFEQILDVQFPDGGLKNEELSD